MRIKSIDKFMEEVKQQSREATTQGMHMATVVSALRLVADELYKEIPASYKDHDNH